MKDFERNIDGEPQIPEGVVYIVEAKDWYDGRGFKPDGHCQTLEEWRIFKDTLEDGVMDMTFQIREAATGRIIDTWVYRGED